jgi:hypothetical protein
VAGVEIILVLGVVGLIAYLLLKDGGLEGLGLGLAPPSAEAETGAENDESTPPDEVTEAVDTSGGDIPDEDQLLDPQPIFIGVPQPVPVPYFIYDDRDDNRNERCKCRKYDKRRFVCSAHRRKGVCYCECRRKGKVRFRGPPPPPPPYRKPPWHRPRPKPPIVIPPKPKPPIIPPKPKPIPRWPPGGQGVPKTVPTTQQEEDAKNKMAGFLSGDALYTQPGIIRFSGVR